MKFIFLILILLTAIYSEASSVDRFVAETHQIRKNLVTRGMMGQLTQPEEWTQYYLLLCQPQKAWQASEKIADIRTRELFQGTILALSSVPRPAEKEDKELLTLDSDDDFQFDLDEAEIWQDEPEASNLEDSCQFPLTANSEDRKKVQAASRELLQNHLSPDLALSGTLQFSLLALATDVGLAPRLEPKALEIFSRTYGHSPYLKRFRFFSEKEIKESSTSIEIDGNQARVSSISMLGLDLQPHRMEVPWILNQ